MKIKEVVEKYYPDIAKSGTEALLQKEIDYIEYEINKISQNQELIFKLLEQLNQNNI